MKLKLAVPFLVLGVALFNCGGNGDKKDTGAGGSGGTIGGAGGGGTGGGGTGGGTGGRGGTGGGGTGGGGAGGGGAGGGGTGGTTDGGTAGRDGGGGTGGGGTGGGGAGGAGDGGAAVNWANCMNGNWPMIAAMDFCTQYGTTCTFSATAPSYTSMADCVAKYTAATAGQSCRAGHLCNAFKSTAMADKTLHCGHSTGTGPCM